MTRDRGSAVLSGIAGRKSSYSENAGCVVVAASPQCPWVGIRDAKLAGGDGAEQTVVVPLDRFRQFVNGLRQSL